MSPTQGHSHTLSLESSTYEISALYGNPAANAQTHPPNSSDPRESPRPVHPHNKVKKTQRYYNKSFKPTLRHSTGVPKAHCMACKHKPQTPGCQEAPCDGVAETPEEQELLTLLKQETGKSQPCAGGKIHTTQKQAGQQQDIILYTLMPAVFSERISSCLKEISSMPTNPCSQALKDIYWKQGNGTWVAQMLLSK